MGRFYTIPVETVHRLRQGDCEALAEIMDVMQPTLEHYVMRLVHDRQAAEEVVQDTFRRLWSWRERLGSEWKEAWLYTTARRLGIDHLRALSRAQAVPVCLADFRGRISALSQSVETVDDVAENLYTVWLWQQIEGKLSPPYRECLQLYRTGTTYPEIAQQLHIPLGTVKSRLHYAIGRAKKLGLKRAG